MCPITDGCSGSMSSFNPPSVCSASGTARSYSSSGEEGSAAAMVTTKSNKLAELSYATPTGRREIWFAPAISMELEAMQSARFPRVLIEKMRGK